MVPSTGSVRFGTVSSQLQGECFRQLALCSVVVQSNCHCMFTVHCTGQTAQCTAWGRLNSALHGVHCTVHCTGHTEQVTLHTALHRSHCTLHCTGHTAQITLHSALHRSHCTLHCTGHTAYCTAQFTLHGAHKHCGLFGLKSVSQSVRIVCVLSVYLQAACILICSDGSIFPRTSMQNVSQICGCVVLCAERIAELDEAP